MNWQSNYGQIKMNQAETALADKTKKLLKNK
jgi:hypothetical protein